MKGLSKSQYSEKKTKSNGSDSGGWDGEVVEVLDASMMSETELVKKEENQDISIKSNVSKFTIKSG